MDGIAAVGTFVVVIATFGFLYVSYYDRSRTHFALNKDCPGGRPIEPSANGNNIAIPQVGGCIIATNA
jgi:hypothetical protein